ncbi:hypothetical protein N9J07_02135 [Bacteroidia bacterium]|nr:hypothetical protein [Bacteroidia bacterium]
MKIKPIKTEEDYNTALARLELIFDASIESKDGDEAKQLVEAIRVYEDLCHRI